MSQSMTQEPAVVPASDHSLLARASRGSQEAAAQLYRRYADRLLALARARCPQDLARLVDADDIVQSVFRRFFRGVQRGAITLPKDEELWKVLLVITLNRIRTEGAFQHAAKRDVRLTAGAAMDEFPQKKNAERDAAYLTLRLSIAEALEKLIPAHREIVELRIAGYEVADIARQTRRSQRTIERVLQGFRHALKTLLAEEYTDA